MNLFGDEDWNPSHDPDVAALVRADGGDPYNAVRPKAEALLRQLNDYGSDTATPLERIPVPGFSGGIRCEAVARSYERQGTGGHVHSAGSRGQTRADRLRPDTADGPCDLLNRPRDRSLVLPEQPRWRSVSVDALDDVKAW